MAARQITIYEDVAALADNAASHIVAQAHAAVAARGHFFIALSGGSTPKHVYQRLAAAPLSEQMPWRQTYVFFGDERAVPLDSSLSNYRMACNSMLKLVPIPDDHVKPILGQGHDLDSAAQHYARVVRSFVPGATPRFDLVLLGMGPDGHTASLFPNSPALAATNELVVATPVAPLEPHVQRITFTTTLINAAAEIVFLVAGADKARTLANVLEGPPKHNVLPSQQVSPVHGEVRWLLDRAAAGELQQNYG